MVTSVSSSNVKFDSQQSLGRGQEFTGSLIRATGQKIAQLDSINPFSWAIEGAKVTLAGAIGSLIANLIVLGKSAFESAWPTLKPLLAQAQMKGAQSLKNVYDLVKSIKKNGAKTLAGGNRVLENSLNNLLKAATQAGITSNVRSISASSDIEYKIRKIHQSREEAKNVTGLGDGIICNTNVNINRIGGAITTVQPTTTATDITGAILPIPVKHSVYVLDKSSGVEYYNPSSGAGTLPTAMQYPINPQDVEVFVEGYCGIVPSKVLMNQP
jgi:hypothetical protein